MKINISFFVFFSSAYFPKATTYSETVWLKDVTTRFQTDKRTLCDSDLPDKLSFRLKIKSHKLILNLKRNYDVDPNVDIYIVRKLNDGRSLLEKMNNVEKEVVAYYQDSENGAFMTARCVKRSNGQCFILINGNIRIGDKSYDLRPSRNVFVIMDPLGIRYVLKDHSSIETDVSFLQDISYIARDMTVQVAQSTIGKEKSFLEDQAHLVRDMTVERKESTKKEYYLKILVILDSSVWDLFTSLLNTNDILQNAPKNVRRYYSHIMNGVDQLYKGIYDPNIVIHVKICAFVVYPLEAQFPHHFSRVYTVNGATMINASSYIADLFNLDLSGEFAHFPEYSQVMLFTRHSMYRGEMYTSPTGGFSLGPHVCVPGYRVALVHLTDYFKTTSIAAHELGHTIGASHDGDVNATACKAEDGFIMAPFIADFNPNKAYSDNPWLFSRCSVDAFKRTLLNKDCVTRKPFYTQTELHEWNNFMLKLPGQTYSPSMQCQLIVGQGSVYCGVHTAVFQFRPYLTLEYVQSIRVP